MALPPITRLICMDLDGTFYNAQHQVSEANKKAVQDARKKGWEVVLCTGRGPTSYLPTAIELGIPGRGLWLVGYNGCMIRKLTDDGQFDENVPHLFETQLPRDYIDRVIKEVNGRAVKVDVGMKQYYWLPVCGDAAEVADAKDMFDDHTALEKSKPIPFELGDIHTLGPPNKITIYDRKPDALAADLASLDHEHLQVLKGGPYWIDTSSPAHDKAVGVQKLCEEMSRSPNVRITPQDCLAFGDGGNDASMLKLCGMGVAMRNAGNAAKEAANRTSEWSNEEDGVAKELAEMLANPRTVGATGKCGCMLS